MKASELRPGQFFEFTANRAGIRCRRVEGGYEYIQRVSASDETMSRSEVNTAVPQCWEGDDEVTPAKCGGPIGHLPSVAEMEANAVDCEPREIQAGDWVVCWQDGRGLVNGQLYQITELRREGQCKVEGFDIVFALCRFRLATPDDIKAHKQ